jgi:alkanesulfonate monooxygenase SsuD/methylene tetrahydromethanopterin reductase-like flavin-dependent oxidoreductase (luciferase family)
MPAADESGVDGRPRRGRPIPKVGVIMPMFSRDAAGVIEVALRAETLGFDGIFAFDHLFPLGGRSDGPALECFATLAAVAVRTETIHVGSLVTRVVLRPPGLVAKLGATLEALAEGRAILGMGTGDHLSDGEHRVFGFPIEAEGPRRDRLEETVDAVRALLRGDGYPGGDLVPPLEGPVVPRPGPPGGPPLWVGGTSDEVVRIAAASGDAWNGWGLRLDSFARKAALLADVGGGGVPATWGGVVVVGADEDEARRMVADRASRGQPPAQFAGSADALRSHLGDLHEAGARWAVLLLARGYDRLDLIAERVLAPPGDSG